MSLTEYTCCVDLYGINNNILERMDEVKEKFGKHGVEIIQKEVKTRQELLDFFYEESYQNSAEDYLKDELSVYNLTNVLWKLEKEDFFDFFEYFLYLKYKDESEIYEFLEEFIFEEHKKYFSEHVADFIEEIRVGFGQLVNYIFDYYPFSLEMVLSIIFEEDSCFIFLDKRAENFNNVYYLIKEILPEIGIYPELLQREIDY